MGLYTMKLVITLALVFTLMQKCTAGGGGGLFELCDNDCYGNNTVCIDDFVCVCKDFYVQYGDTNDCRLMNGMNCTWNNDCQSDHCAAIGRCGKGLGDRCEENVECSTLYCAEGLCGTGCPNRAGVTSASLILMLLTVTTSRFL